MIDLHAIGADKPSPAREGAQFEELRPSAQGGRGWRGAAEPGEGTNPSQAEFSLNKRQKMIFTVGDLGIDPQDAPAEPFKLQFAFSIAGPHIRKAMNPAVDFNGEFGFHDGEVSDEAADRVLSPDNEAMLAQTPQRSPCDRFRRVAGSPQAPRRPDVLAFPHPSTMPQPPAPLNGAAPHPRPLSRERERGEERPIQ